MDSSSVGNPVQYSSTNKDKNEPASIANTKELSDEKVLKERLLQCSTTTDQHHSNVQRSSSEAVNRMLQELWKGKTFTISQFLVISLCYIPAAFQLFCNIFTARLVGHSCSPWNSTDDVTVYNNSHAHNLSVTPAACTLIYSKNGNYSLVEGHERCESWTYAEDKQISLVSQFDLVCDRKSLGPLLQSLFITGQGIGALVCPAFSDKLGRRPLLLVTNLGMLVFGVAQAFSPNYLVMAIFKVIIGACQQGTVLVSSTLYIEILPKVLRRHVIWAGMIPFSASTVLLVPYVYFLKDASWNTLLLALTSVSLFIVPIFLMCEESFVWLVANGKTLQARALLQRACRFNRTDKTSILKKFDEEILYAENQVQSNGYTSKDNDDTSLNKTIENDNEIKDAIKPPNDFSQDLYINNIHHLQSENSFTSIIKNKENEFSSFTLPHNLTNVKVLSDSIQFINNQHVDIIYNNKMTMLNDEYKLNDLKTNHKAGEVSCEMKNHEYLKHDDSIPCSTDGVDADTQKCLTSSDFGNTQIKERLENTGKSGFFSRKKSKLNERRLSTSVIEAQSSNIAQLFLNRKLCLNIGIFWLIWIVDSFAFFMLFLTSGMLADDLYLNFLLNALAEFPSLILLILVPGWLGRKGSLITFHVLSGSMLLIATAIRTVSGGAAASVAASTVALLGKIGASAAFAFLFAYTPEAFPTNMRNFAIGSSSTAGRIGGALAPFVNLLPVSASWLPKIMFGLVSLVICLLITLLPETKTRSLPQTIDDVMQWYNKSSTQDSGHVSFINQRNQPTHTIKHADR